MTGVTLVMLRDSVSNRVWPWHGDGPMQLQVAVGIHHSLHKACNAAYIHHLNAALRRVLCLNGSAVPLILMHPPAPTLHIVAGVPEAGHPEVHDHRHARHYSLRQLALSRGAADPVPLVQRCGSTAVRPHLPAAGR